MYDALMAFDMSAWECDAQLAAGSCIAYDSIMFRPLSRCGRSCGRRCSLTSKERWGRREMARIPGTGSVCYGSFDRITTSWLGSALSTELSRESTQASSCKQWPMQCNVMQRCSCKMGVAGAAARRWDT